MKKYQKSIQIGKLLLNNRLVMPPMATEASEDGKITDSLTAYYLERAKKSGVSLIITEHSYIDQKGKASPKQVSLADDDVIPSLRKLTDAIHENTDVRVFCQINHAGRRTTPQVIGSALMAPSPIEDILKKGTIPEEMTVDQIHTVTEQFARAAARVKAAGYDGVEIHSAHGYLLNQFYSPYSNHRTDEYGPQNMENRLRFLMEVYKAVRKEVGSDYPVAVRLGGCDYLPGGSTIEDAVEASKLLEKAGVDLIDLSGGMQSYMRKGHTEPGYFADMSSAVKKEVQVPVLVTGGVQTKAQAEELLEQDAADLIGIGRALLKNPVISEK